MPATSWVPHVAAPEMDACRAGDAGDGVLSSIFRKGKQHEESFEAFVRGAAGGVKLTSEIDYVVGLYVKPKVAVSPEIELFARAGFVQNKVTASIPVAGWTGSDTQSDVSYGVGLSYSINKTTALNVDYMNYYNKAGWKANGVTVGVGFKF